MVSLLLFLQLLSLTIELLTVIVVLWVIASWLLTPYHPIREALGRIVEPMLAPIRRVLPTTGAIDISPMVLILGFYVVQQVFRILVLSLR